MSDLFKSSANYRPEVDGLRAVAVLLVVLFHAGLGINGGYVGVDVFFVISGFLITGIIVREIDEGRFSLVNFWVRRVRRIMPALILMVSLVAAIGLGVMTSADYEDVGRSMIAQALMVSNFYFCSNSSYFDGAALEKPLLHTWSLAVEEQFYVILPLFFYFFKRSGRRQWRVWMYAAFAISFACGVWWTRNWPNSAYFLLPARAWELLLGVLLALTGSLVTGRCASLLSPIGLLMILSAGLLMNEVTPFPGFAALVPCLGACCILMDTSDKHNWATILLRSRPMVFVGKMSYSVYLIHWPLISFLSYSTSERVNGLMGVVMVLASLFLGFLSWKYVETPFRSGRSNWVPLQVFGMACTSVFMVLAFAGIIVSKSGFASRFSAQVNSFANARFDHAFYRSLSLADARAGRAERLNLNPSRSQLDLVLWGDSHAMTLVPSLRDVCQRHNLSAVAFTRSATPPVLGYISPSCPRELSRDAINYNEAVLKFVRTSKPRIIILGSYWLRDLSDKRSPEYQRAVRSTVGELQSSGIPVFIVRTLPVQPRDVPRELAKAAMIGKDTSRMGVPLAVVRRESAVERQLFAELEVNGIELLDPAEFLTDQNGICRMEWDGRAAYWDRHHLSASGAMRLVPMFESVLTNAFNLH